MILSIEGDEATGKTTLAYSAPLPIVGFAFDMGIERAIKGGKYEELFKDVSIRVIPYNKDNDQGSTAWEGMDITIFELPNPIQLDAMRLQGNTDLWVYAINLMGAAFSDPRVSTLVIDTMTVARRTKASSHLENLQKAAYNPTTGERIPNVALREQLIQIEYGKVNDAIRDIYTTSAGTKKNLVATHHRTDEYKNLPGEGGRIESTLTGNRVLEGLAQTHRFVDIALLTTKDNKQIKGELVKCGYSLEMEGTVMDNPTWDSIANLISTATEERIELDRRNYS
ncbi:hypothetical protein LCGC14_1607640 [marine sediment metagenome]|uniref:Uncharacterized protein n=1 Tax=marine sediment metagenome TaxID=412755 RepID=A0A0F9I9N7_9ZZZZ